MVQETGGYSLAFFGVVGIAETGLSEIRANTESFIGRTFSETT
jgi:hypothetical protein